MDDTKIWAHSGDSHFLEPDDLWHQILPKKQAERMPRTELVGENEELVTVDGKSFRRQLPKIVTAKGATGETIAEMSHRPPGRTRRAAAACTTSTQEGIWGEVMYASIGLWCSLIEDPQADPRRGARRERVAGLRDPGRQLPTGWCARR